MSPSSARAQQSRPRSSPIFPNQAPRSIPVPDVGTAAFPSPPPSPSPSPPPPSIPRQRGCLLTQSGVVRCFSADPRPLHLQRPPRQHPSTSFSPDHSVCPPTCFPTSPRPPTLARTHARPRSASSPAAQIRTLNYRRTNTDVPPPHCHPYPSPAPHSSIAAYRPITPECVHAPRGSRILARSRVGLATGTRTHARTHARTAPHAHIRRPE
ncbi:hypothetical protein HETIRDRAFT_453014 [Heterobasidion irregulare TC 32-1]|uniref:Uncharacterized protein n=1 Tax=Heterobasidion irregulare (strain TC 32-1) TaxID=747525 RepID=W4K4M6_HETIT|nr:uncharacterized protein HETIRDRAFT_453014 [Heterobasidion irregulare TC 32-1]ETW80006.1 hypothetical protein HETIRDRAFT_453014 [Heterobasidion irregulare TC 32-1]